MKNPALGIMIIIGGLGVIVGLALVLASVYGVGRTYEVASGEFVGGLPVWVGIIPLAIGALSGIGALVLWGLRPSAADKTAAPGS